MGFQAQGSRVLETALSLRGSDPRLDFGFIPRSWNLTLATESWKWEKAFPVCFQKASALSKQLFSEKPENQNRSQSINRPSSKPVF